jgi:hypothetical protein
VCLSSTLASHFCWNRHKQQGPFAPPALPGFLATADPSATLSPSAHFPGSPVIGPTLLQRFRAGARRASPVAQDVLVIVPSLPPRRSEITVSVRLRLSMLPSPSRLRARPSELLTFEATFTFTFITARRLARLPKRRSSIGFRNSVSLLPAIQATGPLTLAPAGLSPTEHASLRWTHNRTSGSPAYGSPVDGFTYERIDAQRHGLRSRRISPGLRRRHWATGCGLDHDRDHTCRVGGGACCAVACESTHPGW